MKKYFLLLIVIFNTCLIYGQVRIAFLEEYQNDYNINSAIICDIMLKLKGFEWYDTHVLNVKNKRTINSNFEVSYDGKVRFYCQDTTNTELKKVLIKVTEYMETYHTTLYVYDKEYLKLLKQPRLQNNHIKWGLSKVITSRKQYYSNLIDINNPLLLFTKSRYDNYVELEKEQKKLPLSCGDWMKMKILELNKEPIKSSLDYGITNDDFLSK